MKQADATGTRGEVDMNRTRNWIAAALTLLASVAAVADPPPPSTAAGDEAPIRLRLRSEATVTRDVITVGDVLVLDAVGR